MKSNCPIRAVGRTRVTHWNPFYLPVTGSTDSIRNQGGTSYGRVPYHTALHYRKKAEEMSSFSPVFHFLVWPSFIVLLVLSPLWL